MRKRLIKGVIREMQSYNKGKEVVLGNDFFFSLFYIDSPYHYNVCFELKFKNLDLLTSAGDGGCKEVKPVGQKIKPSEKRVARFFIFRTSLYQYGG